MKRDEQIELAKSAEERTAGYLRAWISRDPAVKASLHRQNTDRVDVQDRSPTRARGLAHA